MSGEVIGHIDPAELDKATAPAQAAAVAHSHAEREATKLEEQAAAARERANFARHRADQADAESQAAVRQLLRTAGIDASNVTIDPSGEVRST